MDKNFLYCLLFMSVFCALNCNDSARNPFEFAPPVMPHEQLEKKEILSTEPAETRKNSESSSHGKSDNANSTWEIVKQSDQGTVVRSPDGSLRKIKLPES